MSDVAVATAPAAASSPAPASAPSAAPAAVPSSAPASVAPQATPAPATPTFGGGSGVKSSVDPAQFRTTDEYAKAVLAEQLAAGTATEEPATEVAAVAEPEAAPVEVAPEVEVAAPDAEVKVEEPAVVEEPDFQLEPETIVTPELLSKMVTDNPDFGKLLESDSKLKGQLYKTAREAAELQPYKEICPDLESLKSAVSSATTFNDVRNVFMGSTTKEGTIAALGKIAELSYERDENGEVVMENGNPVIGQDFYSFVDHTVAIDLEHRKEEIQARLDANQYHVGAKTEEERDAAIRMDQGRIALLDDLLGQVVEAPAEVEQLPPHLQKKAAELAEREKALNQKQQGEKVEERAKFEKEMQTEANKRIADSVGKILGNVEKQGGVISPYLKDVLAKSIPYKTIQKISANPALVEQMNALQRLPLGSAARDRRLAALDRAYQMYLPEVAREEIKAAGVQIVNGSKAKLEKINGQAQHTQKTEPKGSIGPAGTTRGPMTAEAAYETAKAEWSKANPGKRFDKVAESHILGRVVNLQLQ